MKQQKNISLAVASYCHYTHPSANSERNIISGEIPFPQLGAKGQLFIESLETDDPELNKAHQLVRHIITETYYADKSSKISTSLDNAFMGALQAVDEIYEAQNFIDKIRITTLIMTREGFYIAHLGESLAYQFSKSGIRRLGFSASELSETTAKLDSTNYGLDLSSGTKFRRRTDYIMRKALHVGEGYLLSSDLLLNKTLGQLGKILKSNSRTPIANKLEKANIRQQVNLQIVKFQRQLPLLGRIATSKTLYAAAALVLILVLIRPVTLDNQKPKIDVIKAAPQSFVSKDILPVKVPDLFVEEKKKEVITPPPPVKTKTLSPQPELINLPKTRDVKNKRNRNQDNTLSGLWDFINLSKNDYQYNKNRIYLKDSQNIKKIVYRTEALKNFSISVDTQILQETHRGRHGLVFGYKAMKKSPYETYYLLSIHNNNEILLQKYSAFKKTIIKKVPIDPFLADRINDTQLKLTCRGAFITFSVDGLILLEWRSFEVVEGLAGIFASPNLAVAFSNFKLRKLKLFN